MGSLCVWGWGLNTVGQVGNGGVTNVYEPVRIEALDDKDIIAVHAGEYHSIALSRDGRVYTWGANEKGQLGVGGGTIVRTPTLVNGIPKIKAISAGTKHTILLGVDGYVYSFGDNASGQLGAGKQIEDSSTPVKAQGLNKVISIGIGAGGNSTKAVRYDGTVWGWGENDQNQINSSGDHSYATPTQIVLGNEYDGKIIKTYDGKGHVIALLNDGRVIAWGKNNHGQLGRGTATTVLQPVDYVDVFDGINNYVVDLIFASPVPRRPDEPSPHAYTRPSDRIAKL